MQRLEPGARGDVSATKIGEKKWRADCRFRPGHGPVVRRRAVGESRAKALAALDKKLRDELEATRTGVDISSTDTFGDVAELWRNSLPGTVVDTSSLTYRQRLDSVVLPAMQHLRLHEITVPLLNSLFEQWASRHGFHSRRSIRTVITQVLQYAVDNGALSVNPARSLRRFARAVGEEREVRSLTRSDRDRLYELLDADRYAVQWELAEIVRFMLGTGCRIGEALGAQWRDLDDGCGRIRIRRNVVYVKNEGETGRLVVHEGKTESAVRAVSLPDFLSLRLETRRMERRPNPADPVFPAVKRDGSVGYRYPTNVGKAFRRFIRRNGYTPEDATVRVVTHLFRKTAVTVMDEAGLSAREIADHVGHANPAMTQSGYMGRRLPTSRAAAALDGGMSGSRTPSGTQSVSRPTGASSS